MGDLDNVCKNKMFRRFLLIIANSMECHSCLKLSRNIIRAAFLIILGAFRIIMGAFCIVVGVFCIIMGAIPNIVD